MLFSVCIYYALCIILENTYFRRLQWTKERRKNRRWMLFFALMKTLQCHAGLRCIHCCIPTRTCTSTYTSSGRDYPRQAKTRWFRRQKITTVSSHSTPTMGIRGGGLPLPEKSHFTEAVYIRLFIAQLLPPTVHKVLYLDSDTLVVDSLKELWETDISDVPVAAVPDASPQYICSYKRLEYDMSYGYYNSGVLLLNLTKWRDGQIAKECVSFLLKNPEKCRLVDQDALNYCLRGKIKTLSFRYNYFAHYVLNDISTLNVDAQFQDAIRAVIIHPAIVHFVSSYKPWHANYLPVHKPLQHIWLFFKAQTPWKKVRLKKVRQSFYAALKTRIIKIAVAFHILKREDYGRPSPALVERCGTLLSRLKAL